MGLDFPSAPTDWQTFRPGGGVPTFLKWAAPNPFWSRWNGSARRFNYMTNAAMKVNQLNNGSSALATGSNYPSDQWWTRWNLTGGGLIAGNRSANINWPHAVDITYFGINTPQAVMGSADYALFHHRIEGSRMADLQWGTSGRPAVLRFYWAAPPGTYAVKLTNHDWTRVWYKTFTVTSTAWTEIIIPIQPPASEAAGPWNWTNGIGLQIEWVVAMGAGYADSSNREGQWVNLNVYFPPGVTINGLNGGSNVHLAAPGLYADDSWTGVPPPFEHQPYEEALADCQRYIQKIHHLRGVSINATSARLQGQPFVPMRVAPAVTIVGSPSAYDGSIRAITGFNSNVGNDLYFHLSCVVATGLTGGRACGMTREDANYMLADARM